MFQIKFKHLSLSAFTICTKSSMTTLDPNIASLGLNMRPVQVFNILTSDIFYKGDTNVKIGFGIGFIKQRSSTGTVNRNWNHVCPKMKRDIWRRFVTWQFLSVLPSVVCHAEKSSGFNTSAVKELAAGQEDHEHRGKGLPHSWEERHNGTFLASPPEPWMLYGIFQLGSRIACDDSVHTTDNICGIPCSSESLLHVVFITWTVTEVKIVLTCIFTLNQKTCLFRFAWRWHQWRHQLSGEILHQWVSSHEKISNSKS